MRRLAPVAAMAVAGLVLSGCGGQRVERSAEEAAATYGTLLTDLAAAVRAADPAVAFAQPSQRVTRAGGKCWHEMALSSGTGGAAAVFDDEKAAVNEVLVRHGFPRDEKWRESQAIYELSSTDRSGTEATVVSGRRVNVVVKVPAPDSSCPS